VASYHKGPTTGRNGGAEIVDLNPQGGEACRKGKRDARTQLLRAKIAQEWLYHLGVPTEQIPDIATKSAICLPCIMPFCTAFYVPRRTDDRPNVVPEHVVNFAFIGQFAETERDTIFTTEYSVRTAIEAVYTLLDVKRAVPEVWGSMYDIRCWLKSIAVKPRLREARAAWTAYGGT
jgi:myosin-crossreactive antigen